MRRRHSVLARKEKNYQLQQAKQYVTAISRIESSAIKDNDHLRFQSTPAHVMMALLLGTTVIASLAPPALAESVAQSPDSNIKENPTESRSAISTTKDTDASTTKNNSLTKNTPRANPIRMRNINHKFENYQRCPVTLNPLDVHTVQSDPFVLQKITIDERFSAKLTRSQRHTLKQKILNALQKHATHFEAEERLNQMINSKNFKIVIVENFPENPAGAGVFEGSENTIYMRDPGTLGCNLFQPTIIHESHHGYILALRTNGDPQSATKELGEPFSNATERAQLDAAIAKGEKFVTGPFRRLHEKATQNKLTEEEQKQYQSLVYTLRNYQPRCAGQALPPQSKQEMQKKIAASKNTLRISPIGQTLYVTYLGDIGDTFVAAGHFVRNLNDTVNAFIQDTQYRMAQQRRTYQSNFDIQDKDALDRVTTTENDAEVMADSPEIVKAFYPDVHEYHRQFYYRNRLDQQQLEGTQNTARRLTV